MDKESSMGQIVKATFINRENKTIVYVDRYLHGVPKYRQGVVRNMLEEINKKAPATSQFSYVSGSISTDCTRNEYIAYLKVKDEA